MRKLTYAIAGLLLALGMARVSFAAGALPSVTVAVAPSPDMALLIVAVRHEFLKNQGLDAKLELFDSSPAALQGVVAGRADITANTEPPQLAARARGGKIVQVMTGYLSGRQNGLVVNGKLIAKPADFAGKAIGVQRGSGGNYHMVWFLERNNVAQDKIEAKYMAAPDQIAALARGDIAGFFSWEPFLSKAAADVPGAKVYSRSMEDGLQFAGNVVMREDLAKNNKAVAVKIVKGLIAAADWMSANVAAAAKIANEVLKAPSEDLVATQIQNLQWPGTFKKSVVEQEIRIAQWGAGIKLFPTNDPKKLVEDFVYPALIKEAAPGRTDL
ncbi:MAG: ABC transporter substrate-binding protein [Burkholderiales bacterium]|nr:ABC transporter substrate-binding protein [Burkholderiales bacterium]